jgi:integrase
MSVRRRKDSPYFQIRFKLAGREIRHTARTADRAAAEELEQELRSRYWRQIKLGEKHYTWIDAIERMKLEYSGQRSWERTQRAIDKLNRLLEGAPLNEITRDNVLKIREVLARQTHNGKRVKAASVNRVLAVLRTILNRCVSDWQMLDSAPKVPQFRIEKVEPSWATREQIHALLAQLPLHSAGMTIAACATGMRRSEVTNMQRAHVDLKRRTAYVPAAIAKNGEARVVPLNDDACEILRFWMEREKHHPVYVFSFRGRAPIRQVSTRAWREACAAAGLAGFRFHDLRHTWASWQLQAGTPLGHLQQMGGWKSFSMVQRYAHLAPGHLAAYAENSALGPAPPAAPKEPASEQPAEKVA